MGFGGIPIQKIDEEGTKKLLHAMAEKGINYIDSARGYTVSERYIGYGLEGIRDKFVLATKSMARTKEAMAAVTGLDGKADIIQNIGLAIVAFYQMVYSQDRLCHNSHFHFFSR